MKRVALTPGTMGLCALAIDLVGVDNVPAGSWGSPVYIVADQLPIEDVEAAVTLIQERGRERGMPITATWEEM